MSLTPTAGFLAFAIEAKRLAEIKAAQDEKDRIETRFETSVKETYGAIKARLGIDLLDEKNPYSYEVGTLPSTPATARVVIESRYAFTGRWATHTWDWELDLWVECCECGAPATIPVFDLTSIPNLIECKSICDSCATSKRDPYDPGPTYAERLEELIREIARDEVAE